MLATAQLAVTVKSGDADVVGRRFSNATMELALAGFPGFTLTTPPTAATAFGVYWPTLVPVEVVEHRVVLPDGTSHVVPPASAAPRRAPDARHRPPRQRADGSDPACPAGSRRRRPLRGQGRQREHRAVDPRRRVVRLAA